MRLRQICCLTFVLAGTAIFLDRCAAQDTAPVPDAQVPTEESSQGGEGAAEKEKPTSLASYYIGLMIGQQMKSQGLTLKEIDLKSFMMALSDELSGRKPRLDGGEIDQAVEEVRTLMQSKAEEMQKAAMNAAAASKEKAQTFLAANAQAEGVKALPSGLQYKVLKQGSGPSPKTTDTVRVHYTGKLLSGEVFDSSVQNGQPAEFQVAGLIPGWQQALPLMKVGDKWTLYVPPDLAYGLRGSPPVIGPNELLIFEMELLDIVK